MSNTQQKEKAQQPQSNQQQQTQQPEQKTLAEPFDEATMENIRAANEQLAYEDENRPIAGVPYIKFVHHMERKVLKFTGKWKEVQVQARDFVTKDLIPGKMQTKYQIECFDVTNDPNNTELSIWERGLREYRQIIYYMGQGVNIMQVVRNGQPNSKNTTYMISPAVVKPQPRA